MIDDVPRLSNKEAIILEILIAAGETYGLDIVRESNGKIGKGTLYVTLGRMVEKGFLTSRQEAAGSEAPGPPRRMYQATGLGKAVLKARTNLVATAARLSWGRA